MITSLIFATTVTSEANEIALFDGPTVTSPCPNRRTGGAGGIWQHEAAQIGHPNVHHSKQWQRGAHRACSDDRRGQRGELRGDTPPGATTLAPGATTTFAVRFTPPALGNFTAGLHIASNDADESPFDLVLTGSGVSNADFQTLAINPGAFTPAFAAETLTYWSNYTDATTSEYGAYIYHFNSAKQIDGQRHSAARRWAAGDLCGHPGLSYRIERSADLVTWETLHTIVAPPSGLLSITDNDMLSHAYYRTIHIQ